MTLLVPLGLLGLLGIVALIIIYIIRPNYQQKFISSTYVWKLSLKYKKKRIPVSKLRNILLIICQILILTLCAAILSKPAQVLKTKVDEREVIAIIDSSASMRTGISEETRFDRAVEEVEALAEDTFNDNGIVSIIVADSEAAFLVQRATSAERTLVEEALKPLYETNEEISEETYAETYGCAYGESDVDGAITLCEEVLLENPSAKIYLYTDMGYSNVPEGIEVVNVTDNNEWNAAILDASAKLDNNYYTFYVDVAYYCTESYDSTARSTFNITLNVNNSNPNTDGFGTLIPIEAEVYCERNQTKRLVFITQNNYDEIAESVENMGEGSDLEYIILAEKEQIFSYEAVYITIDTVNDSLDTDNEFNIFNGQKEILKVQYASGNGTETAPSANPFFRGALLTVQSNYADKWDIRITEVKTGEEPALEGFDLYIFEHLMPEYMPTDGVVFLSDPDKAPDGAGFKIEELRKPLREEIPLTQEVSHDLLKDVNPDEITIYHNTIISAESDYMTIVSCDTNPVIMVKNEPAEKVLLMNFSIHHTTWSQLLSFPLFMCNVFDYFFPETAGGYAFEVYESVTLNARGDELSVSYKNEEIHKFDAFPSTLQMNLPGNYVLKQTTFTGKDITEWIFVKIPASESNIWRVDETLDNPYRVEEEIDFFNDLLPYLAAVLVALLFLEWWLQSRDTM